MKHKISIFIVLCLTCSVYTSAQTFEEYARQQDAQFADYAKKQDEALKKYAAEMDKKLQELDRQWTEFLKQKFAEFETKTQKQPVGTPKPKTKPAVDKQTQKEPHKQILAETSPVQEEIKQPITPPLQKAIPENAQIGKTTFQFYGTTVNISYPRAITQTIGSSITEQAISDFYGKLSETPYSILVNSLLEQKTDLNLNDYAFYLLTKQASEKIAKDNNSAVFLQWFFMMKLGYKVRIGYNAQSLYILIPTTYEIYEKPFFTLDNNLKYYVINGDAKSIFTYNKDFPEAKQIIDLDLSVPLNLTPSIGIKNLKFTNAGKTYNFKIEYNKNQIAFYNDYPLCDIRTHFAAGLSAQAKMSLAENLQPILRGKSEQDAVGVLLAFVQTAFEYKTDPEQFGREKFFFAEEILHYPYSDCDDRAVFFSYLVREFLNMDVAGIKYSGHIAALVKFNDNVAGDYLTHNGQKFVVCDPTFINAPVGMSMPQYAGQKAQFLEVRSKYNTIDREQEIWRLAMQNGAYRGSNLKDAATDKDGNVYITGYFSGQAKFGTQILNSKNNSRDVFVASYNRQNKLNWVKTYGNRGNESGYSLQIGDNNEIYVAFSFSESFSFDTKFLIAKNTGDIAVARLNSTGKAEWVSPIGIENIGLTDPFVFSAQLDTRGKVQPISVFRQMEEFNTFGLQIAANGQLVLTGANYATAELKITKESFASGAEFSAGDMILTESSKLVAEDYNPAVAGLFAAFKLIGNSTVTLPGTEVQKTIDKHNPNFKKVSPTVYASLGVIQFIRNSEGIITIRTNDGQEEVNFQSLRISNNARFKISLFNSGNQQLDVMNGISVGKSIIWYNLNSLKIFKTGDMVVDYDIDHTKIRMNIVTDVLE